MSQPVKALLEPLAFAPGSAVLAARMASAHAARSEIVLSIHEEMAPLEPEWRQFERIADGTAFQTFDWLSLWLKHVGAPAGVRPAIVLGRSASGGLMFLLPLAVEPAPIRRLTFLGDSLCDYNAPLLAPDFSALFGPAEFRGLWRDIRALLQSRPQLRHDLIALRKMPETVGAQRNPFLHLEVALNPSGAHLTHLGESWDAFYTAKRSSATRRRDRTKRKRLAERGEVRFVHPRDADETARTLERLIEQKTKSFARMGVQNLFARPGHRAFFFDLATNPRTRELVHVSRLDVGAEWAAINLALTFRDTYYHVLASYCDGALMRFGPGAAHLRDLLQHAIEHGFQRFDFTIGDERYKLEWSDTFVPLFDHAAAATLRGWPVVFLAATFRRLKRLIKQTPFLWRCFSLLRAAVGSLGGARNEPATGEADDSPPIAPR